MRIKYGVLAIAFSGVLAVNSSAHHIESDDLDSSTVMSLDGKIVNVEWANPHVILHVEVLNEYGAKKLWLVHADTPSALLRSGLNRNLLNSESDANLEVYLYERNNCATACLSYGINITLNNGRTFSLNTLSDIEL